MMKTFGNLRIGVRLGLAFAFVLALLIAIVAVSLDKLTDVNDKVDTVVDERYPQVLLAYEIQDQVNAIVSNVRAALLERTPEAAKKSLDSIVASRTKVGEAMEKLDKSLRDPKTRALFAAAKESRTVFVAGQNQFIELVNAGNREGAIDVALGRLRTEQHAYQANINKLVEELSSQVKQAGEDATREHDDGRQLILAIGAIAFALAGVLAYVVTVSITRPINQAVQVAQTVAAGDLTSRIEVNRSDETGRLLAALKAMNDSLTGIVSQVRQSSDSIATGSSQIATGNQDLSQRTEEQASNLQQTASSMEQLTSTVKNNADTARAANQMATSARDVAAQGGAVVSQVVQTMEEITLASKKIADINGVIDSIAFQTNILALNAAVEAARAGEQGRGFAVVAGEVRNLAQRSAQAAKEIKTLINDSTGKVESGSRLVGDAGRTMDDIVTQVKRVNDMLAEISAATSEQTTGIGQISNAVTQLDQVTQQNAALVEESAAAAESLKQQANRLVNAVAVFKLGEGATKDAGRDRSHATPSRVDEPAQQNLPAVHAVQKPKPAAAMASGNDDWTSF
ncbi:methyl-accepting chemotaxis protein [Piscinibacter sp. XHJ-5]|uniref:methyl-accepting chemotaxis protein n=1 Tax=Piscinibacter sp. XHJ-5 TaxID=3037797 RepID=UPI00245287B2|nr:methyl-accepting chemotaxis protein [Piscinibacter sp. XHJ-5]